MRKWMAILFFLFAVHSSIFVAAQETPLTTEQQLENETSANEAETEDDTYLQELAHFRKEPLNLNMATIDELKQLRMLSDLQIDNFIGYRNLFGYFIHIYELQAIPGWDLATIKKILPFVFIGPAVPVTADMRKRFTEGNHSLLMRITQVLEKSKGFDRNSSGTKYLGSPQRVMLRYRYNYKNLLQFGIVADKDAGEQLFRGAQKKGFDHYSFHLFARKIGPVLALALGDFTVNMGQGLIQWQGLAFKKSAEAMGVKRQSAVLRPYNSAGEFYFHRGIGMTVKMKRFETTFFASLRKLSANFIADTVTKEDYISSFLTSGYNRTSNEIADRNNLTQTAAGSTLHYKGNNWHIAINGVYYHFSLPLQKRDEPYNLYAISGKNWYNVSMDYSYTHKNTHFFGEVATDKNLNTAIVQGALLSVDPRVDISLVYRNIHKAYQAVNGNAFTESSFPTNEKGLYAGITIRPAAGWRIDAYADLYKFPWLKYLVDAPSYGKDFLLQLVYTPYRGTEIYTRFRAETKQANEADNTSTTNFLVHKPRKSWRTHLNYKLSASAILRNRVELLWYDGKGKDHENGFLAYVDYLYKPLLKPYSAVLRLQYFETTGYHSRLYAYENDVQYSYSIPAFSNKGLRYYLVINYDLSKRLAFWLRFAQTVYRGRAAIGSGPDEIPGNSRTELKVQAQWQF